MSQVKQLIIVTFKTHLTKRMFGVRQQDVRGDKATQDPTKEGEMLHQSSTQKLVRQNGVKYHYKRCTCNCQNHYSDLLLQYESSTVETGTSTRVLVGDVLI